MPNPSRSWLLFLILLSLLCYAEWLLVPPPAAPKKLQLADEAWVLPTLSQSPTDAALAVLVRINTLWGKLPEKDVAPAGPVNPSWRIVGVAGNGAERFVMIKVEGQPEQSLAVNDKLPGGSKILSIGQESICLLVNGKKRTLSFYKTTPQIL